LTKLNEIPEQFAPQEVPHESEKSSKGPGKKEFVEPLVSVPVDVLEATTFFQLADTAGATN
jgi:hypothetical protein